MGLGITATLLTCVAGAGVAVGALTLEPPAAPVAASSSAPSGQHQAADPAHGQPGGYGSAPSAQNAAPAGATLEISGFQFSAVTVSPGATVTVVNRDSSPHTATARDGSFDTGTIDAGGTGSFTAPAAPGSYEFFCGVHPSMSGTLNVG